MCGGTHREVDGDHVEPARGVRRAAIGGVILAHRDDLSLFLRRHFLDRIAKIATRLGLHLYKYYRACVVGDDIDLAGADAVIPFDNGVSEPFELAARERFAFESELLSRIGHVGCRANLVPDPQRASRGTAGCGRLERHGSSVIETASSKTDCTRDSALTRPPIGIARL